MANEIRADYDSGSTLYAVIRNQAGKVWHVAGGVFEDWGADGHDADDASDLDQLQGRGAP